MKVVILAGGLGTRLRPLFPDQPKVLVPVDGKPFLEHQLFMLAAQGFTDFILCVGYLAKNIQAYFQDGSLWGWKIGYAVEQQLMGTAGAILNAAPYLEETFLVLNGDTYLATDYQHLVKTHWEQNHRKNILATLALVKSEDSRAYGSVQLAADGQISAFHEKNEQIKGQPWINAGAYVMQPGILSHIPPGQPVSLEREVFPALAGKYLYSCPVAGTLVDMGTPQGYQTLSDILSLQDVQP